jgi:hypothetical protein
MANGAGGFAVGGGEAVLRMSMVRTVVMAVGLLLELMEIISRAGNMEALGLCIANYRAYLSGKAIGSMFLATGDISIAYRHILLLRAAMI